MFPLGEVQYTLPDLLLVSGWFERADFENLLLILFSLLALKV